MNIGYTLNNTIQKRTLRQAEDNSVPFTSIKWTTIEKIGFLVSVTAGIITLYTYFAKRRRRA